MKQYPRIALLRRQQGHANFLSQLFSTKKPDAAPNNQQTTNTGVMFNGKPIPEGFKLKSDNSGLDLADGYEADPADPTKARKKSQNDPLTNFKDLFKISPDAGADKTPAFNLDPEALKKVSGNLNFTGQLTPELLAKLQSGDQQAVSEVLNSLGRNVYTTLMSHMPVLTEQYVGARLEHAQKGLGQRVKSTLTQQSLSKIAADNPVLKEQLDTIGQQLLTKFPDADPDWIAEQTKQYFVEVAKALGVKIGDNTDDTTSTPDTKDLSKNPNFNWADYITKASPAQQ